MQYIDGRKYDSSGTTRDKQEGERRRKFKYTAEAGYRSRYFKYKAWEGSVVPDEVRIVKELMLKWYWVSK